ncbi:MAG: ABC transporter permease [Chloroflexota bacterium]|jgi:NitT/TauT family transport system permease protein
MKSVRTAVLLLILWELAVFLFQLPEFLLPAPHRIIQRLLNELTQPYLQAHIAVTLLVSLHGLLLGAMIGVTVGWIFYHDPFIRDHLAWLAMGSQAIPVIALAPLFLIWIPETYWARVWVATIITFFPIYAATYTALDRIAPELREVARLYGASRVQTFIYLESVQAAPVILSGIQTSMALATTGAVVGEFLGGRDGLGALINVARGLFDTTLVFVSITLLVVITTVFHLIIKHLATKIYAIADGQD